MKNRSAASDRSPSPCQVEKNKFHSDSSDSGADPSARNHWGHGGPTCRAVPEVCPGERGLLVRSPAEPARWWVAAARVPAVVFGAGSAVQDAISSAGLPWDALRGRGCSCPGAFASKPRAACGTAAAPLSLGKPGAAWGGSRLHRQCSTLSRSGR